MSEVLVRCLSRMYFSLFESWERSVRFLTHVALGSLLVTVCNGAQAVWVPDEQGLGALTPIREAAYGYTQIRFGVSYPLVPTPEGVTPCGGTMISGAVGITAKHCFSAPYFDPEKKGSSPIKLGLSELGFIPPGAGIMEFSPYYYSGVATQNQTGSPMPNFEYYGVPRNVADLRSIQNDRVDYIFTNGSGDVSLDDRDLMRPNQGISSEGIEYVIFHPTLDIALFKISENESLKASEKIQLRGAASTNSIVPVKGLLPIKKPGESEITLELWDYVSAVKLGYVGPGVGREWQRINISNSATAFLDYDALMSGGDMIFENVERNGERSIAEPWVPYPKVYGTPGDSGSPLFVETSDGALNLIGIYFGVTQDLTKIGWTSLISESAHTWIEESMNVFGQIKSKGHPSNPMEMDFEGGAIEDGLISIDMSAQGSLLDSPYEDLEPTFFFAVPAAQSYEIANDDGMEIEGVFLTSEASIARLGRAAAATADEEELAPFPFFEGYEYFDVSGLERVSISYNGKSGMTFGLRFKFPEAAGDAFEYAIRARAVALVPEVGASHMMISGLAILLLVIGSRSRVVSRSEFCGISNA